MSTDLTATAASAGSDPQRNGSHPPAEIDFHRDWVLPHREFSNVPRRFSSAFAVRCARRVAPLVLKADDPEVIEWLDAIGSALDVFARWTQGEAISLFRREQARGGCVAVRNVTGGISTAQSAIHAALATVDPNPSDCASHAASAAISIDDVVPSMRADFDRLCSAQSPKGWDDDSSVPPDFFGPLWVGEEPEWSREGWAKLKAYREEQGALKPPPKGPGTTLEQLEGWFAELEKLREERQPYPSEEEVLADWNWLHERMNARAMGGYLGRFVGILNKEVVGTDTDATRLELALAHKYPDINPDRFVIFHVG
jgi:hypothetical protein